MHCPVKSFCLCYVLYVISCLKHQHQNSVHYFQCTNLYSSTYIDCIYTRQEVVYNLFNMLVKNFNRLMTQLYLMLNEILLNLSNKKCYKIPNLNMPSILKCKLFDK